MSRIFELATKNKKYVNGLNLQKIKTVISPDSDGDIELNGSMVFGPVEHKTTIRFEKMDDFDI